MWDAANGSKQLNNKSVSLTKNSRTVVLQHIMLSVQSLLSALAWARLEKGHGEGGKTTIVKEAYRTQCQEENIQVDFTTTEFLDTAHFKTFSSHFKNYNRGCNRFLQAYIQVSLSFHLVSYLTLLSFGRSFCYAHGFASSGSSTVDLARRSKKPWVG